MIKVKRKYQLARKLIEAREKARMTQTDVENTGIVKQSKLSKIENGELNINALLLIDLAKIYNVGLSYFEID
jgi:transcriptional regulator with XRE-family HTH domain